VRLFTNAGARGFNSNLTKPGYLAAAIVGENPSAVAAMAGKAFGRCACPKEFEMLKRFIRSEDGTTAIEYALLAALIAMVLITALTSMGTTVNGTFNSVATNLR
jgi:pilus assembly protein Flp/PilA